jgi:hypothetical protein
MNDPGTFEPSTQRGAVCSAHPYVEATSTCLRCGDFLCESCRTDGESVCAACRAKVSPTAFPFRRDAFDIGGLFQYSWERFKAEWFAVLAAGVTSFFVLFVVSIGIGIVQTAIGMAVAAANLPASAVVAVTVGGSIVSNVISFVLQTAAQLAGLRVCFDVLEGRTPSIESYLRGLKRVGAGAAQMLLFYAITLVAFAPLGGAGAAFYFGLDGDARFVAIGIIAIIAFFPMLWLFFGFVYAQSELAYDLRVGPVESMRRSWAIVRGHRLHLVATFLIGMILVFAGLLACCVGVIPAMGVAYLFQGALFLALRRGLLPTPGEA